MVDNFKLSEITALLYLLFNAIFNSYGIFNSNAIFNSYGTDRVYPPRDHMVVNCQKVYFGFYKGNGVKLT